MRTMIHARLLVLAGATALLAACGGGGGGGGTTTTGGSTNVPGTGVPTSATSSVAGLISYLQSLIASTDETSDPVVLGDAVLATSETDEATPLP